MQEHHLEITRTARYYTCGPADWGKIDRIWIVCHGYGQMAGRFVNEFTVLDNGTTLIVAPEALSRYYVRGGNGLVGASWMTREDRLNEIRDYVAYLDMLYRTINDQIGGKSLHTTILGFSQGTATAARWGAMGQVQPDRLILWGGLLPHDLETDNNTLFSDKGQCDIVYVLGDKDGYLNESNARVQMNLLEETGVTSRFLSFHGGHRIDSGVLHALANE